jgi:hypothetical protein
VARKDLASDPLWCDCRRSQPELLATVARHPLFGAVRPLLQKLAAALLNATYFDAGLEADAGALPPGLGGPGGAATELAALSRLTPWSEVARRKAQQLAAVQAEIKLYREVKEGLLVLALEIVFEKRRAAI